MQSLSLNRLIVIYIACGFGFLFVDNLAEHFDILGHEWASYIPIVISAIGFAIALAAAITWQQPSIKLLHLYLMITIGVGLAGIYFHNAERVGIKDEDDEKQEAAEQKNARRDGETAKTEDDPPIFAPLAFAGLGAFGLLGTSRRWQTKVYTS
jgi:hypothetical protein